VSSDWTAKDVLQNPQNAAETINACLTSASGKRDAASARIAELEAFIAELEAAAATETMEVDQALGRALHYPPNPDGQPGVCTGEHTSVTLAVEAANRIAKLEAIVERLCSLPVATAAVRRARRHLPMCSNMPDDDGVPENAIRIQAVLREAAEAAGEEL